jgi:hypothetical protein
MKKRSAIKNDLFAPQQREGQIDHLGDPLAGIDACIDFKAIVAAGKAENTVEISTKAA